VSAAEAAAVSEAAAVVAWFRARQRRKGKQCIWLKHGVEIFGCTRVFLTGRPVVCQV